MEAELRFAARLDRWRRPLLAFIRAFGDARITRQAVDWLRLAPEGALQAPGCRLLVAREGNRLAAVCGVHDYGRGVCFVVVRPEWRGRGLGRTLLARMREELGELTCRVALDNAGSLAMCRAAGLIPADIVAGPTGKPTIVWTSAADSRFKPLDREILISQWGMNRAQSDVRHIDDVFERKQARRAALLRENHRGRPQARPRRPRLYPGGRNG